MNGNWWTRIVGGVLAQGDLLPDCLLPVLLDPQSSDNDQPRYLEVRRARLIVVTQSCDLQSAKVEFVALCPIHTLAEFEAVNPLFAGRGKWEEVRKGRIEGLHLLAAPDDPLNNRAAFVVDFGHIVSLPLQYLSTYSLSLGSRWRLSSPYLEHFSQSFARFFVRVGLPTAIPAFK